MAFVPTTEAQRALRIVSVRLHIPSPGRVDGRWGPKTERSWNAWMLYQREVDQNFPVITRTRVGGRDVEVLDTTDYLQRLIRHVIESRRPSWWTRLFGENFV